MCDGAVFYGLYDEKEVIQYSAGFLCAISLMSQLMGTLIGVAIAFVGGLVVYGILKKMVGLRLTQEEEYQGADLSIHKIAATPQRD